MKLHKSRQAGDAEPILIPQATTDAELLAIEKKAKDNKVSFSVYQT